MTCCRNCKQKNENTNKFVEFIVKFLFILYRLVSFKNTPPPYLRKKIILQFFFIFVYLIFYPLL